MLGVGATRFAERIEAAIGINEGAVIRFEASESVPLGGLMTIVPFLEAQGLFSYKSYYSERENGYYDYDTIILLIAFIYLGRIKNFERLKHYSPGELGKLLGIDRAPEVRCLRNIFEELTLQERSKTWISHLSGNWMEENEENIFYIDGRLDVYNGQLATLGKKHSSRQKLCLPGTMEFWVNNCEGQPYFYVTGEVNEKLMEIIQTKIIDRIKEIAPDRYKDKELLEDDAHLFTIVFDREGYSIKDFKKLNDEHKVAVITYRKNVKEKWDEEDFSTYEIVDNDGNNIEMELCEKEIEIDDLKMREIRRKCEDGHQTSVLTTNKKLSTLFIALFMFARWCQENFFRYMRLEYDIDRIIKYGIEQLNKDIKVVNPKHSKLTYEIKKIREKISRRQAVLLQNIEKNIQDDLQNTFKYTQKQSKMKVEIDNLIKKEQELKEERKQQPYKITIAEMPDETRYNKLLTESKLLQNIIKIICYRAETAFVNNIDKEYKKKTDEKRAVFKSLMNSRADIIPDYQNKTLTIRLYSLSNPRDNKCIENLLILLNDTETKFPGTDLTLIYKTASY